MIQQEIFRAGKNGAKIEAESRGLTEEMQNFSLPLPAAPFQTFLRTPASFGTVIASVTPDARRGALCHTMMVTEEDSDAWHEYPPVELGYFETEGAPSRRLKELAPGKYVSDVDERGSARRLFKNDIASLTLFLNVLCSIGSVQGAAVVLPVLTRADSEDIYEFMESLLRFYPPEVSLKVSYCVSFSKCPGMYRICFTDQSHAGLFNDLPKIVPGGGSTSFAGLRHVYEKFNATLAETLLKGTEDDLSALFEELHPDSEEEIVERPPRKEEKPEEMEGPAFRRALEEMLTVLSGRDYDEREYISYWLRRLKPALASHRRKSENAFFDLGMKYLLAIEALLDDRETLRGRTVQAAYRSAETLMFLNFENMLVSMDRQELKMCVRRFDAWRAWSAFPAVSEWRAVTGILLSQANTPVREEQYGRCRLAMDDLIACPEDVLSDLQNKMRRAFKRIAAGYEGENLRLLLDRMAALAVYAEVNYDSEKGSISWTRSNVRDYIRPRDPSLRRAVHAVTVNNYNYFLKTMTEFSEICK